MILFEFWNSIVLETNSLYNSEINIFHAFDHQRSVKWFFISRIYFYQFDLK